MNMQILTRNEGLVKVSQRNKSKEVTTTSLKVAEFFNKRHTEVLRTIQNLECSPEFRQRNFASAEYLDKQGKPRPMIEMTKDGFTFIAMGFTGKEAAKFKEDYINAFNEMHDFLNSEQLSLIAQFNKALLEIVRKSVICKTYIIRKIGTTEVKIGKSIQVEKRIRTLKTQSGANLEVLAIIPKDIENMLHKQFAEFRTVGEWFYDSKGFIAAFAAKQGGAA